MCQEFNNIIKKFKEIKKLNYVESINNDFNGFYNYEMNLRRLLKYPPYYYLVSLKVISKDYNGIGLILVIYSGREDRIRTSRVLRLS